MAPRNWWVRRVFPAGAVTASAAPGASAPTYHLAHGTVQRRRCSESVLAMTKGVRIVYEIFSRTTDQGGRLQEPSLTPPAERNYATDEVASPSAKSDYVAERAMAA